MNGINRGRLYMKRDNREKTTGDNEGGNVRTGNSPAEIKPILDNLYFIKIPNPPPKSGQLLTLIYF